MKKGYGVFGKINTIYSVHDLLNKPKKVKIYINLMLKRIRN